MSGPADNEVFKYSQLEDACGGDHEMELEIVDMWFTDLEEQYSSLKERVEEAIKGGCKLDPESKDGKDLTRPAHTIKGTSGTIGALKVEAVGKILEELAKEGGQRYAEIPKHYPELESTLNEFRAEWEKYKATW
eukprot:TRINITY_DN10121_c0_g1_i1.p1 TRINITY_DN10121_c0_g1~~TRINITY_DN10121_c0_g1_i1.p1  ORF type:complete len:134 (-),score=40.64 TRINITY_DN10121_c0_g1_i1:229-630(-)